MKKVSTSICLGLGDNIVARIIFDMIKHEYDEIRISHDKEIMRVYKGEDPAYSSFLQSIGTLLFTEYPYYFDNGSYTPINTLNTVKSVPTIIKPNLQPLLCRGKSLNLGEEYIVITTKIRGIQKHKFLLESIKLWKALSQLSSKYKIVILGEREVEKTFEYKRLPDLVYGIYEQIIANISTNRIIDLTIPSLGNTPPNISKIQQDGLIMQQAKCVITFGLGGNVWLAAVTSNQLVGLRDIADHDEAADLILNTKFSSVRVFKDWTQFIQALIEI